MKLNFSINFKTKFKQNLFIIGELISSINENNSDQSSNSAEREKIYMAMDYTENGQWTQTLDIPNDRIFVYKYMIKEENAANIYEVGDKRYLKIKDKVDYVNIFDQWQGHTELSPFLSKPFTDIFFKHNGNDYHIVGGAKNEISIVATIPCINKQQSVYICGNNKELGSWNSDKAIKMKSLPGSKWGITLKSSNNRSDIEYKFLIKDGEEFTWENGENRSISSAELSPEAGYLFEHSATNFEAKYPKFTGTAIPIFSIRTKNSGGVGEFTDLKKLADWTNKIGQNFIQILPINDTCSTGTWTDSYPYSAISIFALHSIYLNLDSIGGFSDSATTKSYRDEKKELNSLEMIDYERVMNFKNKYLSILFEEHHEETFKEEGYQDFYKNNSDWLLPYCSFCVLRDKYKTANFNKWGKDAVYSDLITKKLWKKGSKSAKKFELILFTQYHLHKQLKDAVAYAHKKGIALKGDIPIGITPHSVEAWVEPGYFRMDSQAGAPPDDFAVDGQNWGFPTYNWEEMGKDGYQWWKKRFIKMGEYFDAYRIDHILGFFRIWEIPISQTNGLLGYFNPSLPYSEEEISRYGLGFHYDRLVKPYINYSILKDLFDKRADYIADNFLSPKENGFYEFKTDFDNQRKIEDYFSSNKMLNEATLKDKLQSLVSEVLFIEDPHKKGMYHPRISAQYTYSYRALSDDEKSRFNALYNEFYYHRNNLYWQEQAMKKLPELISATNMLTCAEDLGMIPACVPETLSNLRVSTLEIQRMPKDPNERFSSPTKYPYLSVAATGTHDTSTLRAWWEEDHNATQDYYNHILGEYGAAPQFCEPEICKKIIKSHLDGGSMLTILPIQDWLSIDPTIRKTDPNSERINIPSNPKHYWRFRLHLNMEDLIRNEELTKVIKSL